MKHLLHTALLGALFLPVAGPLARAADLDYPPPPPVRYERPVMVERPVIVERPVVVERPIYPRPLYRPYLPGPYAYYRPRRFYGWGPRPYGWRPYGWRYPR